MSGSRASSDPLTSPSPSPDPPEDRKTKHSSAKVPGLDSSSELSDLTEDEHDGSRASAHSSTPQASNGTSKRKRGSIVPAPMWDWAYKSSSRKPTDHTGGASGSGSPSPAHPTDIIHQNGKEEDVAEKDDNDEPKDSARLPGSDEVDEGGEAAEDIESEEEDDGGEDPEEEDVDDEPSVKVKTEARDGSPELTEVEDAEEESLASDRDVESEGEADSEVESDAEDEPLAPDEPTDDVGEGTSAVNADAVPVVSAAPAGSSIMAGQQLIKTPSPSPSTSPEPEPRPSDANVPEMDPDATGNAEAEPEDGADADLPDNVETADPVVDVEQQPGVGLEEVEPDVQPAHRAEALDVLAAIELKFALLREVLYVEKMEDLAMEEAMVLQGIHPEMIHLLDELQVRHDRRLELAAKKRHREDDHVSMMRKLDDEAIMNWWKFEKDGLQSAMHAEANRKRRKLERERRVLERSPPIHRVPPPPAVPIAVSPLTTRDLLKFSTSVSPNYRSRLKRKHKSAYAKPRSYPTLSVLSITEVNSDIQQLARRPMPFAAPFTANELGPGTMIPQTPGLDPYVEYNALGFVTGQQPFGHTLSQPPPPLTGSPAYPPQPHSVNRPHHQTSIGVPTGATHQSNPRAGKNPSQPHVQTGSGGPPGLGSYGGVRPSRRSPSPPSMQGFERAVNGSVHHGGINGPGRHAWANGPGPVAGPSSSIHSSVNGWTKEQRRIASSSKDAQVFDLRERDMKPEKEGVRDRERERDRDGGWYENGVREMTDDHTFGRAHGPPPHSNSQPHRHTLQHQNLHGIPHHHHVVHHHHGTHHHHGNSRNAPGSTLHGSSRRNEFERQPPGTDYDHPSRGQGHLDHQHPTKANGSPFWKSDEPEPIRDRGRSSQVNQSTSSHGPPPPSDRLQSTPFVMTPTQAMQAYPHAGPSQPRRDQWTEEGGRRPPSFGDSIPGGHPASALQSHPIPFDGPPRSGHVSQRLPSPPRLGAHGLPPSPRRNAAPIESPPLSTFPNHSNHAPSRHPTHSSAHHSPHMGTSSLKSTRPISPVQAKLLPSASYSSGQPSGSGSSGVVTNRLGTPLLAGPGARPDGAGHPNGHISMPHFSPSSLTGPGAQPLMPPANSETSHLLPPKMNVVPLGNGP